MLARVTDTIIHTSFYILLFAVPFLFTPWNYELFEFNKMLATYALTVVIVSAWAIKCVLSGRIIFRRTLLDLPLLLFLLSQILSTYFSIDQHTSIWGYYSRSHGGLLSTIAYLLLYWAFVSNMSVEQVKTAIKYLLTSAIIISVWGILEHFGLSPSCLIVSGELAADCWVQDVQTRVFATLGQPNWLAAWLAAIIPLTWATTISKFKDQSSNQGTASAKAGQNPKSKVWVWVGISVILFATLLFTKSRSGLLGFGAAFAVFWLLYFRTTMRISELIPRPFLLFVTCYLLLVAIFGTRWTPSVSQWLTEHRTKNISKLDAGALEQRVETEKPQGETVLETGGTESGEIRKIVWKGALDIWRTYPLFGSGVETFAYSYYNFRPIEHNNTSEWDFLYNKAHNEYLNFLSTTGVLGLGAYLLLIGTFLFWSISKLKTTGALLAGYVSILVTNFFGFSVVNVATLFFLFPAMAVALEQRTKDISKLDANALEQREYQKLTIKQTVLITFALITMFYVLSRIAGLWQADSLYTQGTTLSKNGQPGAGSQFLTEALNLRPNEPNYLDAMASSLSSITLDLAENNEASVTAEIAVAAQEVSDRAIEISPRNLSILKSRSTTFYKLSFINETYLLHSIEALERATVLAPTDPKVHYNLGVLYSHIGQNERAKELFEKTLMLKPDFEDAKTGLQELQEQPQ